MDLCQQADQTTLIDDRIANFQAVLTAFADNQSFGKRIFAIGNDFCADNIVDAFFVANRTVFFNSRNSSVLTLSRCKSIFRRPFSSKSGGLVPKLGFGLGKDRQNIDKVERVDWPAIEQDKAWALLPHAQAASMKSDNQPPSDRPPGRYKRQNEATA